MRQLLLAIVAPATVCESPPSRKEGIIVRNHAQLKAKSVSQWSRTLVVSRQLYEAVMLREGSQVDTTRSCNVSCIIVVVVV